MAALVFPRRRIRLASWPTPLERAPRLARALGLDPDALWLKREDLTGLGAGGNKIRKLEWTVATALDDGADTLVTTGAPQSNHARLTAAAAARTGLRCILVFPGSRVAEATGNLVLDSLLGAEIEWVGEPRDGQAQQRFLEEAAQAVAGRLRDHGRHPAIIPFGGSSAVGAHGYRLAGSEIIAELDQVDHVVTAVGSGGTMAGLVAALGHQRVLGVHVGAVADPRERVAALLSEMGLDVKPAELRLSLDHVGDGYSTLTTAAAEALTTAARTHGVILDPIYSARALAGLTSAIRDGEIGSSDTVVFLMTGGLPGLFGQPATVELGSREACRGIAGT
jgi:D-cysteine desulfhydrase